MKNSISLFVVIIVLFLGILGTTQAQKAKTTDSLKIKRTVAQITTQELGRNLARMSYKNVNPEDLSQKERDSLASGKIVIKKNPSFFIPVNLLFRNNIKEIQKIDTYVNQDDMVSKNTKVLLGKIETAADIAIFSFYLPLLVIFLIPLVNYNSYTSKKIDLIPLTAAANLMVVFFFLLGWLLPSIMTDGPLAVLITFALLVIIALDKATKTEKALIVSGIIAGTSVGIFTSRISELSFGLFSSQMAIIWIYLGLYILASVIGLIIMWKSKSADEAIYIYFY